MPAKVAVAAHHLGLHLDTLPPLLPIPEGYAQWAAIELVLALVDTIQYDTVGKSRPR